MTGRIAVAPIEAVIFKRSLGQFLRRSGAALAHF
jgi:hypothetical protein